MRMTEVLSKTAGSRTPTLSFLLTANTTEVTLIQQLLQHPPPTQNKLQAEFPSQSLQGNDNINKGEQSRGGRLLGKYDTVKCKNRHQIEMLLGCNYLDNFCRMHYDMKSMGKIQIRTNLVISRGYFAEQAVYLRQGLHNGVQQRSHSNCHLQELQYCGDTS